MRGPFIITAPFATPDDIARSHGISRKRAFELRKLVEDSLTKKGYIIERARDLAANKNGANGKASRSHRLKAKVRASTKLKSKSGKASRGKTARAKEKAPR